MIKYIHLENVKKKCIYVLLFIFYIFIGLFLFINSLIDNFVKSIKSYSCLYKFNLKQFYHNKLLSLFKWNSCNFKKLQKRNEKIYFKFNKIPNHICIVFKYMDVSLITKKKLINYLLDIIIFLYNLKVEHLTIYISDNFFDSIFYDDLMHSLFENDFFMKPKINNGKYQSFYNLSNEFIITKLKYNLNKSSLRIFFPKLKRKTFTKTRYIYEKYSLQLIFMNKENSHNKIIEEANKYNLLANGEIIPSDSLQIYNENIEKTFEFIINEDLQLSLKKKKNIFQLYTYWNFLKIKKKAIFCKIRYYLKVIKKFIKIFTNTKEKNYKLNIKKHKKTNCENIINRNCKNDYLENSTNKNKDDNINKTLNVVNKEYEQNNKNTFNNNNNVNTFKYILNLLDNLIIQEKEAIGIIKTLISNNIPLYVKPIYQDIFTNNNNKIFNINSVDVVISLRIGLIDFIFSYISNYKKKEIKRYFFQFLLEYFSSFIFLYDIVHPFQKNGIQPWILSESELYEFFSFNVKSIKKALNYYSSSIQRFGY